MAAGGWRSLNLFIEVLHQWASLGSAMVLGRGEARSRRATHSRHLVDLLCGACAVTASAPAPASTSTSASAFAPASATTATATAAEWSDERGWSSSV